MASNAMRKSHSLLTVGVRWIIVVGWMCVIFFLSNESAGGSSARSGSIVAVLQAIGLEGSAETLSTIIRKSAHVITYMVLGGLLTWAFAGYRLVTMKIILCSIALACLFAISDELHQALIPGRSAEVRDVLIDTVGAIVGAGVVGYIYLWLQKRFTDVEKPAKIAQ